MRGWRESRAGSAVTLALVLSLSLVVAACSDDASQDAGPSPSSAGPPTSAATSLPPSTTAVPPTTGAPPGTTVAPPSTTVAPAPPSTTVPARPPWLGTRPLPLRPDGIGVAQPTPPELAPRVLPTVDVLPPPPGDEFVWDARPVPPEVAARSTWEPACPVALDELRYVTVAFVGFDGRVHTGELLLHADAVDAVVEVFRRLHAARYPVEEMRITSREELDAPPTGDGNTTGAFVCRPAVGSTTWSQHAFGRAVDLNPFQNPYVRGDIVIPELATAYVDRELGWPGMLVPGDVVVEAFAAVGWGWGGDYRTMKDWHHFSATGR